MSSQPPSSGPAPDPAPGPPPVRGARYDDDEWWRHGVVYQVYPRSFADSDGDGTGDLPGIIARLDYLTELGVDAIWLSPIYPSPGRDVGYDVSDHSAVDQRFGTEADFDRLVAEAHGRGLRVILDLVMNHTSDEHAWFQASRNEPDGAYGDWYLWRDPAGFDGEGHPIPPNNWLSFFGGPGWQWDERRHQFYFHTFLVEQPELNWRNPDVEAAQWSMVQGWLARGVDGFRLDVFNAFLKHPDLLANPVREGTAPWDRQEHVHDRDSPDFPELIGRFRAILDAKPGRMSVGELFASDPAAAPPLVTERHLVFDWALLMAPWSAAAYRAGIESREARFGPRRWLANVLSNHDQSRHATRLAASAGIADTDAVARAAAVVLLTLRGTPFLYYGEELGMLDVPVPDDRIIDPPARRALVDPDFVWWNRDLCRSPFAWTDDPAGHGFTTGTPWLPIGQDASRHNVATEAADPASVLGTYRRVIALRREHDALRSGTLQMLETDAADVVAWSRSSATERVIVVVNFGEAPATVSVRELSGPDQGWVAVGGTGLQPATPTSAGRLALTGLEAVILAPG